MSASLLNKNVIKTLLTFNDPYCHSHGSEANSYDLAAGILYYALTYAYQAKVCVCLGSGSGFVPRLMRQAQRDLKLIGSRTILVDGAHHVSQERKAIWGSPNWLSDDAPFRINYPDIEIVLALTATAYGDVFVRNGIHIDYLHIDADHHYAGAKGDWNLYRQRLTAGGIITLHDTVNYREPCGVPRLLDEIRATRDYEVLNIPIGYGTAILRKRGDDLARRIRKRSRRQDGRHVETSACATPVEELGSR